MEETELFKLFSKIKEISDGAYELVKALKNAKLAQSDLDAYRKEVEKYDNVPKSILDKQVNIKLEISNLRQIILENILAAALPNIVRKQFTKGGEAHQ